MKLSRIIILIILILPLSLFGQAEKSGVAVTDSSKLIINRLDSPKDQGKVKVVQDPRLTNILRKHTEYNKAKGEPGWRILIYKGGEISKANQNKADFEESFSQLGLEVNIKYSEPDFSTLVGGFRTKEDAFRYMKKLQVRFPNAYLVRISLD